MTLKELYTERKRIHEAMLAIQKKADDEKRSMNAEESHVWDQANADLDAKTKDIERREKMDQVAHTLDQPVNVPPAEKRNSNPDPVVVSTEERQEKENLAFRTWLRGGEAALSHRPELRSFLHRAGEEYRTVSYTAQTETTTGGGYLVPTGFSGELEKALKAYGGVREVARTLNTPAGNTINWPTVDDTSNVGEQVAINVEVTAQALAFGQVNLLAFKYSSKAVLCPIELLQDSAFNVEEFIREALAERLGRITNTAFTTGAGSTAPQGVTVGISLGVAGGAGSANDITYSEILDLVHSVNSAYRKNARFMCNDLSLKKIKQMVDTTGRPLWVPNMIGSEPTTICGYPYTVNDDMADMTRYAITPLIFGDFSKYIVRNVMPVELYRMSEKYIELGQVAFIAFMRTDGRWINTAACKYFQGGTTS